ncbi:MAG TPA: aldehyde dehydrogenase family protein, partial [Kofleriaceae bacterium]
IGGEFVESSSGETMEVLNPATGEAIAEVPRGTAEDVDRAVDAAARAFPAWSRTPASERGRLLFALASAVEANAARLAELESRDTGHPIRDSANLDVPRTVLGYRYFAGMADKIEGSVIPVDAGFLNFVEREPVGVIGQIVPWNFPLMFTSWKLGPALAAGNTVVLKPAELTPLSSLAIAELVREVGFPPGVVNIIPGYGATAGQRIAEHDRIAKVTFTGSTVTGRKIVAASAGNLKKLQLELGGKGPNIVFDDAELDAAVNGSAFGLFHNQGQACIAGTRLLLHASIADRFLDAFLSLAKSIRLGDPLDRKTEMGPLTSRMHQERVLAYCDVARREGGEILIGGRAPTDPALSRGCFVEPTIVRAAPHHTVCRDEVFGPFATVTTFTDEDEAIRLANDTRYGLGAGLWTRDIKRGHRVAKAIRSGMVWVNCYKRVHPGSPFGGVGESGYGREMGFDVMREYTQAKSTWINVDAKIPPFYPR